ncbi:tripartite tricarboxylate transporter substrate binding protein [Cupriavidus consociatus]|uniref:tripartite tricarboxylate transporter substrate binding protein n=1 Tax=Cupriavidus consociatus TaxID=2821357 RepID=UPI001AEB0EF2|nr:MULTISPECIES: tripartite tricarboxylate transporter substrate binding protein [unclassified Cupriavidus]MBP0623356.1 tripartite tricarboxylate transporter substrate binding protein [Cupriavidus sp. LEh25]MDK2660053.1 tripartite tricarboxylate transporter substrate binding protein [Cupriavidus sp. LEh21]
MKIGIRFLSLIALCAAPLSGHADNYPSRPITMIVPWQAGGSSDVLMRALAQAASKKLGQPIIIDNRPGAIGTLGLAAMAATAKPDGYTIGQSGVGLFRMPLIQKTSWDPEKDFTYIANLVGFTMGIAAGAQTPYKSWADVVAAAKKNPGKISYGSPGQNGTVHLGMEQVLALAGIDLLHVPYKSTPDSSAALLGGVTQLQVDAAGWKANVDSGKARLLVVWTEKRAKRWPDVPTLKELGYPLVIDGASGIAGPKGMDPMVVTKLNDAFRAALDDPAVQRVMSEFEIFPNYMGPDEYRKYLIRSRNDERKVLDRLGILRADLK